MRYLLLVLALLAPLHGTARAEDAKTLYDRATADYNLGHFHDAATEYEAIYRTHPDSVLLYNIAQSYRQAGDADKALFFYRSYLRNRPNAENREQVRQRIADLELALATQKRPPNEPAPVAPSVPTPEPANAAPPATPAPATATLAVSQPAPAARTPIYKRWWLWTIVGGVAAAAAVGIAVGFTQSGPAPFNANLPEGGPGSH